MNLSWNYAKEMLFIWFVYIIILSCICFVALVIDVGFKKAVDIFIEKLTSINNNNEVDDEFNNEM